MEVVKAFNSNKLHTEIIIKGTPEEPLFRASDIGEVLGITNIRVNIQNFDETEKRVSLTYTPGGNQEVTFLTEKGLYKVLFKSRKPIAETFQNWVCEVVKELRLKGTYSLQQQLEEQKQDYETKLKKTKEIERHNMFLRDFASIGEIIYIIRVKTFENGSYIVKIGSSVNGVEQRYKEHRTNYEEAVIKKLVAKLNYNIEYITFAPRKCNILCL